MRCVVGAAAEGWRMRMRDRGDGHWSQCVCAVASRRFRASALHAARAEA